MTYATAILAFLISGLLTYRGFARLRFGDVAMRFYRVTVVIIACILGLMIVLNPDYLQPSSHLLAQ